MNKNKLHINILNVISAISFVILHINSSYWKTNIYNQGWINNNIIENIFSFGPIIFFMISGATLLDFYDNYDLKEYFRRRIIKTFIPYIFWSILGFFFTFYYEKSFNDLSLTYFISCLLEGKAIVAYWFFIPLFNIYLSIPLIAAIKKDMRKKVFLYIVIVAYIFNIFIPFINIIFDINLGYSFLVYVASSYLIYIFLAYLIEYNEIDYKYRLIIYVAGIISIILCTTISNNITLINNQYNNLNPFIMIYASAIYIFIKYLSRRLEKNILLIKIIEFLKRYTFAIYLLHWFILVFLFNFINIDTDLLSFRILGFIPIVVIVIIITYLIRKIPFVGKALLP